MPEMDCFQSASAIREAERSSAAHVPIVALTTHSMKGEEERCLAAGMDGYVTKPIRSIELFATIEKILAKNRSSDAAP